MYYGRQSSDHAPGMSSAHKYGSLASQPYEENIYNSGTLGMRMG